jgi:hypothetical protein
MSQTIIIAIARTVITVIIIIIIIIIIISSSTSIYVVYNTQSMLPNGQTFGRRTRIGQLKNVGWPEKSSTDPQNLPV